VGIFEDLKAICEITGPIGYPDEVNAYLKDRWRPLGEVEETPVGNLVAHVGGAGPKLLLDAHSDEIAFVVRAIDDRGFIWITTAQQLGQPKLGLDRLLMLGQPALIVGRGGRKVEGLFATVTGHVASFERREQGRYDYNDLFVDIGARSREEAQGLGVTVGSLAIWNATTRRLGPDGKLIYGKALDARMGLAIMTEVARRVDRAKLAFDLYLGCSVQEEIGLVGAASLARYADFAQAISIEVGLAGDIPLVDERDMPVALGKGPVLVYRDNTVHHDRHLTERLADLADARGLPYQFGRYAQFGNNAKEFIAAGIPAVMITPPTRYTHSPFEMCHEDDVEHTIQLLTAYLEGGAGGR
jgi:tetrahedral aminopeptidase